jgi:ketosteroid isomerase-like protein
MIASDDPRKAVAAQTRAQNAHDAEAVAACFTMDYQSEQPLFPDRKFVGREQVRSNHQAMFDGVPDYHVEVLSTAVDGQSVWVEVDYSGTHRDGQPFHQRGVMIMTVDSGLISTGRLYIAGVQKVGPGIDAAIESMASGRADSPS